MAAGALFWLRVAARERGCPSMGAAVRSILATAGAAVLGGLAIVLLGEASRGATAEELLAQAGLVLSGSSPGTWVLWAAMVAGAGAQTRLGLWAPRRDLVHPVSRRELRDATRRNALIHNLGFVAALILVATAASATVWGLSGASAQSPAAWGSLRALPAIFLLTAPAQWAAHRFRLHPASHHEDPR